MGRVGAKEAFDEGRRNLEELAGVVVKTKAVERVSEAIGQDVERFSEAERRAAVSGKLESIAAVDTLYIAMDGTGVPVVPHETEGRKGKDETGRAKTREAKLGCVFTQTTVDDQGRPLRDSQSTTYVGAIETAEQFGPRIYAEAVRRGLKRAKRIVVLGDGAVWIWNIAEEHFHGAIQIVDLYHAREHLAELGRIIYGPASTKAKDWAAGRCEQLDEGNTTAVMKALNRLRPGDPAAQKAVEQAITPISKTTLNVCAMPSFVAKRSLSGPESWRRAAKLSSVSGLNNPECVGLSAVPTPSSPFAVRNSAVAGKNSGRLDLSASHG